MAGEITTTLTTANDVTFAAWISEQVIDAARANTVVTPLLAQYDISDRPSKALDIPKWGALAAAAVAEADDAGTTALSTDKVTATCAEIAVVVRPSDLLLTSDLFMDVSPYLRQIGLALADKRDADAAALATGLSGTVGTDDVDLTIAQFIEAQFTLQNANAPEPHVAVLAPIQVSDLRVEIAQAGGAAFGNESVTASLLNAGPAKKPNGFVGNFLGTDIYSTTNVPTVTNNRNGMMFSMGFGGMGAYVSKWEAKVEQERRATMRATDLVGSACYDFEEVVDAYGVKIRTDA